MTEQGATETRDGTGGVIATIGTPTDDRNIVQRMCAIQQEIGYVEKSSVNSEQHYKFRGIDAFMNALHPLLPKHGVIVAPKVIERSSFERDRYNRQRELVGVMRVCELLVEFTFHGIDGTTLTVVAAGEGADVADKATNKAMAGALKYAIMQTFMVPTQEIVDADQTTPEVPSGSRAANDQLREQQQLPSREEIMSKLDEACTVLGKTRAEATKKWRTANGIGAIAELDDPAKVSDLVLYRFVLSLAPWVEQARAKREREEVSVGDTPDSATTTRVGLCTERQAADADKDGVVTRWQQCTREAGHDDDHSWW